MVTALISALSGRAVRRDVAMTGEVTLRGKVLAIGGLKEKTLAAYNAGVKTVFVPHQNIPDLDEIDPTVKASLEFIPVNHVCEVLDEALVDVELPDLKASAIPTAADNDALHTIKPFANTNVGSEHYGS
jgi:ATP-dependent Lon protease